MTKKLGDLAEKAANIYAAKAGEAIEPEFVEIVGIGVKNTSGEVDNGKGGAGPIIQWFKTEKDMARDPWLRQLENKSDLPGRVLGAFDFGFLLKKPAPITPDPEAKEKGPGTPVYRPISPGFASFYLVPSERAIRVRKDVPGHGVAHLTFILVSPDDLLGFPSPADTKNPSPSFKKTVARFKETSAYYNAALLESWKGELKKKLDLKQGLDLTRAVGYWRVYLFSTSSQFDDEPGRQKLVQAYQVNPLELDFFAAYLRIRP